MWRDEKDNEEYGRRDDVNKVERYTETAPGARSDEEQKGSG